MKLAAFLTSPVSLRTQAIPISRRQQSRSKLFAMVPIRFDLSLYHFILLLRTS